MLTLLHRGYSFTLAICRGSLPWDFAAAICRGYLRWEFTVANCRDNLPQLFAVRICCGYLPWVFVYVSKSFLVYVSKSCLHGSKPFLDVSKSFLFVKCSLLMVFLFVIAVAVKGHRRKAIVILYLKIWPNNDTVKLRLFSTVESVITKMLYKWQKE